MNFTTTLAVIQKVGGLTDTGELPAYAWPGGYPLFYLTEGGILCPEHANAEGEYMAEPIIAAEVNYEDTELWCDHNHRIESAYGEPDW